MEGTEVHQLLLVRERASWGKFGLNVRQRAGLNTMSARKQLRAATAWPSLTQVDAGCELNGGERHNDHADAESGSSRNAISSNSSRPVPTLDQQLVVK